MIRNTNNGGKTKDFFYYNAGILTIKAGKPFQVCTMAGCLVSSKSTEQEARDATTALQQDMDAGTLPCNLSTWDKAHILN